MHVHRRTYLLWQVRTGLSSFRSYKFMFIYSFSYALLFKTKVKTCHRHYPLGNLPNLLTGFPYLSPTKTAIDKHAIIYDIAVQVWRFSFYFASLILPKSILTLDTFVGGSLNPSSLATAQHSWLTQRRQLTGTHHIDPYLPITLTCRGRSQPPRFHQVDLCRTTMIGSW